MLPCMTPWSLVINGARREAAYFLRGLGLGFAVAGGRTCIASIRQGLLPATHSNVL